MKKFSAFVPQQMKTSRVSVTSYQNKVMEGTIITPLYDEPIPFCGMVHFVKQMEKLQDELEYPQANERQRSFQGREDGGTHLPEARAINVTVSTTALATFQLTIQFRQNASWQGSILWEEKQESAFFRSVLELMMLFDSALA